MSSTDARVDIHALLIGVDHYLPPPADHRGPRYKSLSGCVHDVERMEGFLRRRMGVPAENIRKLTASDPPSEPPSDRPTYRNLVAAFEGLLEAAGPGDQVVIHYSGHGGRTPTHFPELKGSGETVRDEGLVPTDISQPDSQYLRDVELGYLLEQMVRQGLFVTLVMDCCHSGGVTRHGPEHEPRVTGAVARGNRVADWERPGESLVASREALGESWLRFSRPGAAGFRPGAPGRAAGWLPRPSGWVLLAACREHELAYEYPVSRSRQGGALTHWLFETLDAACPGLPHRSQLSYRQLHDRVQARVRGLFPQQTPQLEGEGERAVFGTETLPAGQAVNVLAVKGERLLLNTGQAQAVRWGARFAVFPPGWQGDNREEDRLAVVRVEELGGVESWARVVERAAEATLEPGSQALPLDLGKIRLRRSVRLAAGDGAPAEHHRAFEAVWQALEERRSAFLEPVPPQEPAERQVRITPGGEYEICDAAGRPLPNLPPPLVIDDPEAPWKLVDRLVHLARYTNLEELANDDSRSPLHGRLRLELGRLPADYEPADFPRPEPLADAGEAALAREGDWLCLTMRNLSEQPLNLTVINLQPRWNVRQIFPADSDYLVLGPGREERLPLEVRLPGSLDSGTDVLKVFATLDATQFRWLELPILDRPLPDAKVQILNPLEALMAAMVEDGPRSKDLTVTSYASREWTVGQVTVRVARSRRPGSDEGIG